jgi:hypothetical protein
LHPCLCVQSAKIRGIKTFCLNLLHQCFLHVCVVWWVVHVCLSCLMNKIVNQHNPCALVNHGIQNITIYLTKALSWIFLIFQVILHFFKTKSQDLFWWKGFPKLSIYKTIGIYKLVWSHYLEKNLILQTFTKWILNIFEKL